VVGEDDILIDPKCSDALLNRPSNRPSKMNQSSIRSSNTQIARFSNAGHGLTWEVPAAFNRLCEDHILKAENSPLATTPLSQEPPHEVRLSAKL
jgi:pimeloyl-ACP methyl ester carboxylesterase